MWTASSASRTWTAAASASEYTATVLNPSSRQARITRTAISPRLAIRTLANTSELLSAARGRPLQRDVAVLLGGIAVALALERIERTDQPRACLPRIDDVVDVAPPRRDIGVRELLPILGDLRIHRLTRVGRFGDLLAK